MTADPVTSQIDLQTSSAAETSTVLGSAAYYTNLYKMISMLRTKLQWQRWCKPSASGCEGIWVADLVVEGPHTRLHGRQQRAHRKVLDEALDVVQVGHREAGSQALHKAHPQQYQM